MSAGTIPTKASFAAWKTVAQVTAAEALATVRAAWLEATTAPG